MGSVEKNSFYLKISAIEKRMSNILIQGNCPHGELFDHERIRKCGHLKVIIMKKNLICLMKKEFLKWPVTKIIIKLCWHFKVICPDQSKLFFLAKFSTRMQ